MPRGRPWHPIASSPSWRRELEGVPRTDQITLGVLADAYPPLEERLGLTRRVLLELGSAGRSIVTKGRTVYRDVDPLSAYPADCLVHVSLCTVDEDVASRLDPGAPVASERIALVHALHAAEVPVQISAAPWIPGVSDTEALIACASGCRRAVRSARCGASRRAAPSTRPELHPG